MAHQMKETFGNLKSRFGFGKKRDEEYEEYYGDEYEHYEDEFDDYVDDYGYEDESASSYGSVRPVRIDNGRTVTSPRLVSMDDVRASTRIPDSLNRDPLPPRHVTSPTSSRSGFSSRTMVDSSLPPQMTPEGTAAQAAAGSRRYSQGYESLFSPTTGSDRISGASEATIRPLPGDSLRESRSSLDSTSDLSASTGNLVYSAKRSLDVVAPLSYAEVEKVAKSLKAGDAVILSLRATSEELTMRVLDFSFGVAAALDANVECVGNKVFAITRGNELSDLERSSLRNQGVI